MLTSEMRPPFSTQLPHHFFVDQEKGILLLAHPKRSKLALGCAWRIVPRNVEVCDEATCLDMARTHESLLQSLPIGSALQVLLQILPTDTVPGWEAQRQAPVHAPLVAAQVDAIRQGLPHRLDTVPCRLRTFQTVVTLRLPLDESPGVAAYLKLLFGWPGASGAMIASVTRCHLGASYQDLLLQRETVEDMLRAAGHRVEVLTDVGLSMVLGQALDPLEEPVPLLTPDLRVAEQILRRPADLFDGGYAVGPENDLLTARVLSLYRAMPQSYPGLLSAPRAPKATKAPIAFWQAFDGPMTLVTNIAIVDPAVEKARLERKRLFARLHAHMSPRSRDLMAELEKLLTQLFLHGDHLLWSRVHLVLWGDAQTLTRGTEKVMQAARQLSVDFAPEADVGNTVFLQTLPLGFDPTYPKEDLMSRARRLTRSHVANLGGWYGANQGTKTPTILVLNQRGEPAPFDPFDDETNPHILGIGMSGAGKSYLGCIIANSVLAAGASMVIIDRLPSYQGLSQDWRGRYYQIDLQDPPCFNPFLGPFDDEHLSMLSAFIAMEASGGVEPLRQQQLGVLSDGLAYFGKEHWSPARGEVWMSHFMEEVFLPGRFTDDADAKQMAREIGWRLKMFYGRGQYAKLFDGPNTFVIDPLLTVVELSKIGNALALQGNVLLAVMHLQRQFFTAPERRLRKKYFLCDETVFALKEQASADAMEEASLTYRKLRTCCIFLAQYASQLHSPAGQAILKGSPWMFFLQQKSQEILAMKELLNLSDQECALIAQARRYDGCTTAYLQRPGDEGGLVHFVADRYTHLQNAQDPVIQARREHALAVTHGDMRAALALLMKEDLG